MSMTRKIIITAIATWTAPDPDERPDDCDSDEECLDAIKDSLESETFQIDVGDHGDLEFSVTKVEDTK